MIIISNCLNTRNLCMHSSLYEIHSLPKTKLTPLNTVCVRRFDKTDYENGYSRNLLWRLWEAAKLLQMNHLFALCCEAIDRYLQYLHNIYTISTISTRYLHCNNISYDASTMCDETVYWDLNYSLQVTLYTREH